eukprot:s7339_g3.t1
MESILEALAKLSYQDLAAIGVVLLAIFTICVGFPCFLVFVTATGIGPRRAKCVCSHVLRSVKRPTRFEFHKILPRLFLGSLPRSLEDLEFLKAEGVGAVVTLNEPWEMALSSRFVRDDCGLDHLHIPTPDFFSPTQPDIQAAVTFITDHIAKGNGVYVHCNGGRGRSVVCVLCYLVSSEGMTAEEAFDMVAGKRRVAPMRGSCGLHKQWRAVKCFESKLQRTRKKPFIAFKEEEASIDNVAESPRGNADLSPSRDLHVSVAVEPEEATTVAEKVPPVQQDTRDIPDPEGCCPAKPCVPEQPPLPQNEPTSIPEELTPKNLQPAVDAGHNFADPAQHYDDAAAYQSESSAEVC